MLAPKDSGPLKGWFSIPGGSGSRLPTITIFSGVQSFRSGGLAPS